MATEITLIFLKQTSLKACEHSGGSVYTCRWSESGLRLTSLRPLGIYWPPAPRHPLAMAENISRNSQTEVID